MPRDAVSPRAMPRETVFPRAMPRETVSPRAMPRDAEPTQPAHQRADRRLRAGLRRVGAGGGTALRHLDQQAPLRVLFPDPEPGDAAAGRLLNTAGGLAGGDALDQAVSGSTPARAPR